MPSSIVNSSSENRIRHLLEHSPSPHNRDADECLNYIGQMEKLSNTTRNKNHLALTKIATANYLCDHKSDYGQALDLLREAALLMDASCKEEFAVYYHTSLGKNYQQLGETEKAKFYYQKAIQRGIAETKTNFEKKWLGSAYYNLYTLLSFTDPAYSEYEFLQKALEIFRDASHKPGLSNCYNSMARIYFNKGDYKTTIEYLENSKRLLEELQNTVILPTVYSNLGLTYARTGQVEKGIIYIMNAISLAEKSGIPLKIIHAREKLAEVYLTVKDYAKALLQLQIAEKLAVKHEAKKYLTGIYRNLMDVYAALQDFESAHTYDLKYIELILENFREEKSSAILKAKYSFDAEKKDMETALLIAQKEEVEKYARELELNNTELNQITYVASHHLREPLRTITSYVALLERSMQGKLSTEEKEFTEYIVRSTKVMYDLLGDLIAFSGIRSSVKKSPVDLNEICFVIQNELQTDEQKRSCSIQFKNLPVIMGDADLITTLFKNLADNAFKYNTSQRPKLIIKARKLETSLQIVFSDNGIGVDPEFGQKIFMIFERLHTKEEYEGTGIGLAVCKKIVDQMGGRITVEGNRSGGSDFKIVIPDAH